jgi:hypothetical protein
MTTVLSFICRQFLVPYSDDLHELTVRTAQFLVHIQQTCTLKGIDLLLARAHGKSMKFKILGLSNIQTAVIQDAAS